MAQFVACCFCLLRSSFFLHLLVSCEHVFELRFQVAVEVEPLDPKPVPKAQK